MQGGIKMGWTIKKPVTVPIVKEEIVTPKILKKPEVTVQVPQEVESNERFQVVREIPMNRKENPDGSITFTPTKIIQENNEIIHLITIEEALTMILNGDLE